VKLRVRVDDMAELYGPACIGSNRDDPYIVKEFLVNVVLPDECEEGLGSVQLVADKLHSPDPCWCEQIRNDPNSPGCGYIYWWGNLTSSVEAVYHGCRWEFRVLAFSDIQGGACPENYKEVGVGSYNNLTPQNYCTIVHGMRFGSGCVKIGNDLFCNTTCANKHEEGHIQRLREHLLQAAEDLATMDCFMPMEITCQDSGTLHCELAENRRAWYIQYEVERAFTEAMRAARSDELYAYGYALDCFLAVAHAICDYASENNWPSCADSNF